MRAASPASARQRLDADRDGVRRARPHRAGAEPARRAQRHRRPRARWPRAPRTRSPMTSSTASPRTSTSEDSQPQPSPRGAQRPARVASSGRSARRRARSNAGGPDSRSSSSCWSARREQRRAAPRHRRAGAPGGRRSSSRSRRTSSAPQSSSRPVPTKTTARSPRNSMLVGGDHRAAHRHHRGARLAGGRCAPAPRVDRCSRASSVAVVVPARQRGAAAPDDAGRHPRVRRPRHTSSTTARRTGHGRRRASSRTSASS